MAEINKILIANKTVSPIGFGCGPLGVHGFGDVDLKECRKAVLIALDEGVQFFDTSDAYGQGLSEEQLAMALGERRNEAFIATKGGIRFGADNKVFYDNSSQYLKQALEDSLKRLKTEYVELYQLHYWDKKTPIEDVFSCFENMVQSGKIGSYGVSNLDLSQKQESFFSQFPNFVSHSDEFNMVRQQNRNVIEQMQAKQSSMVFLATGVLAQGLLSGKYNVASKFRNNDRRAKSNYLNFEVDFMSKTQNLIDVLLSASLRPVALATAWVIKQNPNIIALAGVKSCQQLQQVLLAKVALKNDMIWNEILYETVKFEHDV